MPEDLKGLIEKINREAVQSAEIKSRGIEEEARSRASAIIKKGEDEAKRILDIAKDEAAKISKSGSDALKQSARDIILSLKNELENILGRAITKELNSALKPEDLSRMIVSMINGCGMPEGRDVVVALKKEDADAIEKHFLSKMKEEVKKGVVLNRSDEIRGGFTISFDGNKSHFDFTDKALADYIATFVNPKLSEFLK